MIEQYSPEWFAARLGKVTASRVADVIAKTKTGPSASRARYMGELLSERLTGVAYEGYTNAAMQWGKDHEADARSTYEFMTDCVVEQVGFVEHPTISMSGASPDGYVGTDGLVEFKCPNTSTHVETLLGGSIDGAYITQMQWQMACSGRKWCDWVSFDPRLPPAMRLHVQRVHSDGPKIIELERAVAEFLAELDGKIAALRKQYEAKEAA